MYTSTDAAAGDQSNIDAWIAFDAQVREAGVLVEGAAQEPAAPSAKVVTPELDAPGASAAHDGPVAEGSEQIEAFYLLDCPSIDAALGGPGGCRRTGAWKPARSSITTSAVEPSKPASRA